MKKYPHTDSTDMILYEEKQKKQKKPKIWLACLSSALAASIFTAGVFGAGAFYLKSQSDNTAPQQQSSTVAQSTTSGDDVTQLANNGSLFRNGKKVLTIPEIASQVGPSVVGVINKTTVSQQKYYDPFSGRYYYSQDSSNGQAVEQGSGSGIIFSQDGYIVTNQHVIDGATEISVILNTGEEYTAKLVGQDTKTDLAVLKIDAGKDLPAATFGDSTSVEVGELAVAIGNPMGQEFAGSVTSGVVSAVNRSLSVEGRTYNLLQTDAAINSGNSGGALINQYGEVIGINSIKLSSADGMGFAIAISEAKPIIDSLMANGYVTGRPLVGISIQETRYGMFIASVSEGSGAAEAGLKEGDLIVEVDGQKLKSTEELNKLRDQKKPGEYLNFKISRDGETIDVQVRLTESTSEG